MQFCEPQLFVETVGQTSAQVLPPVATLPQLHTPEGFGLAVGVGVSELVFTTGLLFEAQVVPSGKQPELQQVPFGDLQPPGTLPQLTVPLTGVAFGFTTFLLEGQISEQVLP